MWVPLLLVLASGTGSAAPAPCAPERLSKLSRQVAELRQVAPGPPPTCVVETLAGLGDMLAKEWEKRPREEWEGIETRLRHFRLLPPGQSLRQALLPIFSQQVAAYYDPERKAMVMIQRAGDPLQDEPDLGGLAVGDWTLEDVALVHELDHALQDRLVDLSARLAERAGDNDRESAFHALLEGQSTWIMLAAVVSGFGDGAAVIAAMGSALDGIDQALAGSMASAGLDDAPPFLRSAVLFPYLGGFRFARDVAARSGVRGLNQALALPPESTRALLHPETWGREPEILTTIAWPQRDGFLDSGWTLANDATWGELELALLLGNGELERDSEPAAGWRGDRLRVYRHRDGRTAAAGVVDFDDELGAMRFFSELSRRLAENRSLARRRIGGDPRLELTILDASKTERIVIRRQGSRVVFVDGLAAKAALEMVAQLQGSKVQEERCGWAK